MQTTALRLTLSSKVFVACGLWLIALGTYFIFLRPALLPEDPHFIGSSVEIIRNALPGLERWLNLVFNVMGGFMVATGVMTVWVARSLLVTRSFTTSLFLVLAGAFSVALMSATNFILNSDFRWLLLIPVVLWIAGVWLYMREPIQWRGNTGRRFFRDQAFHFQTLRTVNNICADGADTGEVLQTISNIRDGNFESWFTAWESTASRLIERTAHIQDPRSRGQTLLRAHNYLRTAEFFLPPSDPKRPVAFQRNVEAFESGLDALDVVRERMQISYGAGHLNAIFYPGPPTDLANPAISAKPLLVLCGGFDSTLEELYFVLVPAAHQRGFSVLTYEGPGQGAVLREQKLTFTHQWELPTTAVLDAHFVAHPRQAKTILIGMSMGGYLAPRAAAFDSRIDGVVAFDVLFDFGAVARAIVPLISLWLRARHADALLNLLIKIKARLSPGFAWSVSNGQWVLGTASALQTMEALSSYTLAPVAGMIKSDVLILAGSDDHFIPVGQAALFASALSSARSVRSIVYDRASGGSEHCQMGAQSLWHADLFDWIASIE